MNQTEFQAWIESKFDGRYLSTEAVKAIGTINNDQYTAYKCIVLADSATQPGCFDDRYTLVYYYKQSTGDYKPCVGGASHTVFRTMVNPDAFNNEIYAYVESKGFKGCSIQIIQPEKSARVTVYKVEADNTVTEIHAVIYRKPDESLDHMLINSQ